MEKQEMEAGNGNGHGKQTWNLERIITHIAIYYNK